MVEVNVFFFSFSVQVVKKRERWYLCLNSMRVSFWYHWFMGFKCVILSSNAICGFALLFDTIWIIGIWLEMGNWPLWHRINLWWGFSLLCDACRYVCSVGDEGIVWRIALTRMMIQLIRSSVIIVGKWGILFQTVPNLFKMVSNVFFALYRVKLF